MPNTYIFIGFDEPPLEAIPVGCWSECVVGGMWFMVWPPDPYEFPGDL